MGSRQVLGDSLETGRVQLLHPSNVCGHKLEMQANRMDIYWKQVVEGLDFVDAIWKGTRIVCCTRGKEEKCRKCVGICME